MNDERNLVPACEGCNKRKGRKMGLWLLLGYTGRWLQPVLWVVKLLLLALGIYLLAVYRSQIFVPAWTALKEFVSQMVHLEF